MLGRRAERNGIQFRTTKFHSFGDSAIRCSTASKLRNLRCTLKQKSTTPQAAGRWGALPGDLLVGVADVNLRASSVAVTGARNFPTYARCQRPAAARRRVH